MTAVIAQLPAAAGIFNELQDRRTDLRAPVELAI
jgi:hypothetical protein